MLTYPLTLANTSLINQRSASIVELTHVVYHIGRNIPFYYGDEQSCLALEWQSDNYIAIPIAYH
jgi:hypothetical protein